jgi:hypothetical protein
MNNTNISPEPKKVSQHPKWTPEEIKKLDEELAEAIRKANEYSKKMGWQEKEK